MDLINLQRAIKRTVENRLNTAFKEGEFDNLPARGKPLADLNEPVDDFWWIRHWIKREKLKAAQLAKEKRGARRMR